MPKLTTQCRCCFNHRLAVAVQVALCHRFDLATPISAQACLITASASLRVASVALASQWVAMPCRSASMQYRRPSVLVNAMPELSPLCHSGSFVRNAHANPSASIHCIPAAILRTSMPPAAPVLSSPLPNVHCCHIYASAVSPDLSTSPAFRCSSSPVRTPQSVPLLFLSVFAIAKLLIPCPCGSARCIAYALPCGSLPVPCSMAQSKS